MKYYFELNECEFIPLNNLLKVMQLVETGGEANLVITDGEVKVNGMVETRKRKKIRTGDRVIFDGQEINVK